MKITFLSLLGGVTAFSEAKLTASIGGVLAKGNKKKKRPKAPKKTLKASIGPYPGTTSDVSGKVSVTFDKDGSLSYKFNMKNLEESITGGTHIHTGTTCDDASLVGGHYWNATDGAPDPWTDEYGAVYTTNRKGSAKGTFKLDNGYGYDDNEGHAVVFHAADGSRVGCGVLK